MRISARPKPTIGGLPARGVGGRPRNLGETGSGVPHVPGQIFFSDAPGWTGLGRVVNCVLPLHQESWASSGVARDPFPDA